MVRWVVLKISLNKEFDRIKKGGRLVVFLYCFLSDGLVRIILDKLFFDFF